MANRVVANMLPEAVDFVLDRRDISHQASLQEAEKVLHHISKYVLQVAADGGG